MCFSTQIFTFSARQRIDESGRVLVRALDQFHSPYPRPRLFDWRKKNLILLFTLRGTEISNFRNLHNSLHDTDFWRNIFGCIGIVAPILKLARRPEYPPAQSFRQRCCFVFVVEYKMLGTWWRFSFFVLSVRVLFAVE